MYRLATMIIAAFIAFTSPANAADFTFLTGAAEPEQGNAFARQRCNFRMSGEILSGDAARFEQFLSTHGASIEKDRRILGNPRIAVLCLDSQGGSLDEGLKIARLIRRDRPWDATRGPFIQTRLEAGATCASACAFVFLAGTLDDWEGPSYPERSMHPTARLGVHSPNLELPGGQYSEAFVNDAYKLSMRSIAEILELLHLGTGYSGDSKWMKASMLEAMLQTPFDSMRYVETVDEAGRWGIDVFPVILPELTKQSLFNACFNLAAWRNDHGSAPYGDPIAADLPKRELPGGGTEQARYEFSINELDGITCETAITGANAYSIAPITATDRETPGSMFALFDPQTPLAQLSKPDEAAIADADSQTRTFWVRPKIETASEFLAAEAPALSKGEIWGPRYGGNRISMWDHNGSMMAWEQKDEFLWIWYFDPRPGLREVGVRPGSLLFVNTPDGPSTGLARRFSTRCEDVIYPVQNASRETHRSAFEGSYRSPMRDCTPGQRREDRLVFDYVAPAPDRPVTTPDGTAPSNLMRIIGVETGLNMRAGPSPKARKIAEAPAGRSDIRLLACRPMIVPGYWHNGSASKRRAMLDKRWCSFEYSGQVGFVSGKYLTSVPN